MVLSIYLNTIELCDILIGCCEITTYPKLRLIAIYSSA